MDIYQGSAWDAGWPTQKFEKGDTVFEKENDGRDIKFPKGRHEGGRIQFKRILLSNTEYSTRSQTVIERIN